MPWTELLLLAAAGAVAVVLHETLRWPLKLPGRHGMEWFAILVFARLASPRVGAATIVAFGAALASLALVPAKGLDSGPLHGAIYLLQGATLDALFLAGARLQSGRWLWIPLAAGLAHAVSPTFKTALQLLGAGPFGSTGAGWAWPAFTHLCFGVVGGAAGLLAWRGLQAARRR